MRPNILILLPLLFLSSCVTQWYEEGVHPAQTPEEMYIEGKTHAYASEQGVGVEVHFSPVGVPQGEGMIAAGWTKNHEEVWYWDDWVNGDRPNIHRDELAWHEVCHASRRDKSHGKKWCECMTERFGSTYCKEEK